MFGVNCLAWIEVDENPEWDIRERERKMENRRFNSKQKLVTKQQGFSKQTRSIIVHEMCS